MSSRLFWGLTGPPGSGKSEAGRYLAKEHGFVEFSGSEFLKVEAAQLDITLKSRADYTNFQRQLREQRGPAFVTDYAYTLPYERICNVGIRNRLDITKHREVGGLVIALTSPIDVRFARTAGNDTKYPSFYDDWLKADELHDDPDPYGQHTKWAVETADHIIDNSINDLDVLFSALDALVARTE